MSSKASERVPQHLAAALLEDAKAYASAALVLNVRALRGEDGEVFRTENLKHLLPALHLVGHSVELSLKAYIASQGVDEATLKRSLNHDLTKALQEAEQRGFDKVDADIRTLIDWLAPYHAAFIFRYPRPQILALPYGPFDAAEIALRLAKLIDPIVRQSVRDRKP